MKTKRIVNLMYVLSWLAFIGLCIKTGAITFSYLTSINNPEVSNHLFGDINLWEYYQFSFSHYTFIVVYKIILFAIEAYIAFLLVKLLKDFDIENAFTKKVANLMQKSSYSILWLWVIAMIHNTHMQVIGKKYDFSMDLFSSDFIFLAAVVFVFTQIVKRGIEIKNENDLTI